MFLATFRCFLLSFEYDMIDCSKLIENSRKPDRRESRRIGILIVERCLLVHCLYRNHIWQIKNRGFPLFLFSNSDPWYGSYKIWYQIRKFAFLEANETSKMNHTSIALCSN